MGILVGHRRAGGAAVGPGGTGLVRKEPAAEACPPRGLAGRERLVFSCQPGPSQGAMKIVIDYDLCEANAVCMDVCPECFRVEEDDTLTVLIENPPERLRAQGRGSGAPVSATGDLARRGLSAHHRRRGLPARVKLVLLPARGALPPWISATPPRRPSAPRPAPSSSNAPREYTHAFGQHDDDDALLSRSRTGSARSTRTAGPPSSGRRSTAAAASARSKQIIWNQELARLGLGESIFVVGIGMAGPTIDRPRHARAEGALPARRCCAATRSGVSSSASPARARISRRSSARAVRDGDDWVVTGQKTWCSGGALRGLGHPARAHRPERAEAPRHHLLPARHEARRASRSGRCAR